MNRLVTDESASEPESGEDIISQELDEKLKEVNILNLGLLWLLSGDENLNKVADLDQEGHESHDCQDNLADRQLINSFNIHPCAITDLLGPKIVADNARENKHATDE